MTHIIHSSDTVKDCAPAVVHAFVTLLGVICRLHSIADVADAARSWARLCEALVSVHLKAVVKQVRTFLAFDLVFSSIVYACSWQYVTVAIETWLRLRTSLLIPMELLQTLEGGVLALMSCCDRKQVVSLAVFRHAFLSDTPTLLTSLQIQQIHACSSAAVRTLLRELVQLHDESYKYTGIA